jgi:hypothetical protein
MTFGDIKTFTPLLSGQENVAEFHIEYFNTRDAENVMTTLNGTSVDVSDAFYIIVSRLSETDKRLLGLCC